MRSGELAITLETWQKHHEALWHGDAGIRLPGFRTAVVKTTVCLPGTGAKAIGRGCAPVFGRRERRPVWFLTSRRFGQAKGPALGPCRPAAVCGKHGPHSGGSGAGGRRADSACHNHRPGSHGHHHAEHDFAGWLCSSSHGPKIKHGFGIRLNRNGADWLRLWVKARLP